MRDTFWNFYVIQIHSKFYLQGWKLFTSIAICLSSVIPLAIALCGIADMAFWQIRPNLAFAATVVSAIWQAASVFLPWQKRAVILDYSIRDMRPLCRAIENYWDTIDVQSDEEIHEKLSELRAIADDIETNYHGSIDAILWGWYAAYAKSLTRDYFKSRFAVDIEED